MNITFLTAAREDTDAGYLLQIADTRFPVDVAEAAVANLEACFGSKSSGHGMVQG